MHVAEFIPLVKAVREENKQASVVPSTQVCAQIAVVLLGSRCVQMVSLGDGLS